MPGYANPQNLNRYSYVNSNPLRYTDPTGHKYCDSDGPENCTRLSNSVEHTAIKYRIRFKGNGGRGDQEDFIDAITREADRMYGAHCQGPSGCTFSSASELYVATHDTTVITFSNSSTDKFCQRNANAGEEGVICGSNSRGKITPTITAHELGHVFNALIHNNGYVYDDPYNDLADERASNEDFPALDVDITPGHKNNGGSNGEDFANMYSMWVFNEWPDTVGGQKREGFMNDNMATWITRLLNP